MGIAHLLYLISGIFVFFIGLLFYLSKDGIERKLLIALFWSVSFGLFLRGFTILVPDNLLNYYKSFIPMIIILPTTIISGLTLIFLYKKYMK